MLRSWSTSSTRSAKNKEGIQAHQANYAPENGPHKAHLRPQLVAGFSRFSETRISLFLNENDEFSVAKLLACQTFDFHPFTNEDNFSVIRICLLMPFLPLRETRNQLRRETASGEIEGQLSHFSVGFMRLPCTAGMGLDPSVRVKMPNIRAKGSSRHVVRIDDRLLHGRPNLSKPQCQVSGKHFETVVGMRPITGARGWQLPGNKKICNAKIP
jgi:hypothetical protein